MILNVVKCDGCNTILRDDPEGETPEGGFTDKSIRREGLWPLNLYHLCGYCEFKAKVQFIKDREAAKKKRTESGQTAPGDRSMNAIDGLRNAIFDEGPAPSFHRNAIADLRSSWPTLWEAIQAVLAEEDPYA